MRNTILFPALGVALLAGTSLAQAQTVETVITPAPAPVVESVPVQTTTETVRTLRSTTGPVRRIARAPVRERERAATETTTQTTIRENIVSAPAAPAVAAIAQPTYTEVVQAPPAVTYPAPLYDVAPADAAPPAAIVAQPPLPAYRYIYQPDRILVIDANTGVAVQALPR